METSWRRNYLRYKSFFMNMVTQYRERSDWKAYLEILLSLATVSVFSIFALRPTILTIAELIGQIEEKKETIAKMDAKIQNLSKAQNLYDRERANILLLTQTAIPQSSNSDVFARQIEALSSKHQVSISSFSLGKASILSKTQVQPLAAESVEPETLSEGNHMEFTVSLSAGIDQYQQLSDFLKDTENLRTPPELTSVQFGLKEDNLAQEKSLVVIISGKLPFLN